MIYTHRIRVVLLAFLILALNNWTAHAQEMPTLFGVIPQEGEAGSEVHLTLDGTGFFALERLDSVLISGVEVPVLDYAIVSNEQIEVFIFIPEELPVGETEISFLFSEYQLDAYFVVAGPGEESVQPVILGVSPQEGEPGSEVGLRLDGQGFFELGELGGVVVNGVETPILDFGIESDNSMIIIVLLPEDIPDGNGEISIFFENAEFSDAFFVAGPGVTGPDDGTGPGNSTRPPFEPPDRRWIWVLILIILIPVARRLFRKPEQPKEPPPREPVPMVPEFNVQVDPGDQQIEPANQPLKMDFELSFIVSVDSGEQYVELHQDKFVESK